MFLTNTTFAKYTLNVGPRFHGMYRASSNAEVNRSRCTSDYIQNTQPLTDIEHTLYIPKYGSEFLYNGRYRKWPSSDMEQRMYIYCTIYDTSPLLLASDLVYHLYTIPLPRRREVIRAPSSVCTTVDPRGFTMAISRRNGFVCTGRPPVYGPTLDSQERPHVVSAGARTRRLPEPSSNALYSQCC